MDPTRVLNARTDKYLMCQEALVALYAQSTFFQNRALEVPLASLVQITGLQLPADLRRLVVALRLTFPSVCLRRHALLVTACRAKKLIPVQQ